MHEGREAVYNVETVLIHRHYKPETYHNDIALIKLIKPIKFTEYILPACLPERDFAEKVSIYCAASLMFVVWLFFLDVTYSLTVAYSAPSGDSQVLHFNCKENLP